ncbi:RAB6A-GEF complex partner protein 2-like isoform X4 [Ornithodoros turicata]|uniref:RAB6A-GEF complex partner protein 2-like isoform X4 n=1 Tax=Ornithodoros turicata TaxID=34597 RepID=UPI003138E4F9
MIEVNARLLRSVVYVAGDCVDCLVTFKNTATESNHEQNRNCLKKSSAIENLAWASAQIHCHCAVDEAKVLFPKSPSQEQIATGSTDTSFIPCRVVYKEMIPTSVPPSYKGQAVRYAYKITIGAQKVNALTKLLRIPIKVFVVKDLTEVLKRRLAKSVPHNPFLPQASKQSVLEIAFDYLEDLTSRRRPNYYNITHQNGKVVRFCLLKSSFRLGEDIVGTFDFAEATIPCVQYSVTLQSEEEVLGESSANGESRVTTLGYCKQHEFCLHLRTTHLALPVPVHITPSFRSDIVPLSFYPSTIAVELRWKLHFEFVVTTTPVPLPAARTPSGNWHAPELLEVQTMVWDLPISLYPTHPSHVANAIKAPSQGTLYLC